MDALSEQCFLMFPKVATILLLGIFVLIIAKGCLIGTVNLTCFRLIVRLQEQAEMLNIIHTLVPMGSVPGLHNSTI